MDTSFQAKETTMRYPIMVLLAAGAIVLSTAPAHADLGDQIFKIVPDDGALNDFFGTSVAISGNTAIVGARNIGGDSGSAYLFDITTGQQIFKLLADDGEAGDSFGRSVAISGGIAIVGARNDQDNGSLAGSAYLFDITTGEQLFKLLAEDGAVGDHFGNSVWLSGNIAIIGADGDNNDKDNGSNFGSAYLFDITTGLQIFKLLPDDGAASDRFGTSVAISGNIAIVGAHLDDDNGSASGSAYLFDISNPANPIQLAKLLADDGAEGDRFGQGSIGISGTTVIVGAFGDDDNGDLSGSAYLFDISDPENPTQTAKLLPDDGAERDQFGISVAIGGTTAIVAALRDDDNGIDSGSAYLFDTTTGQQIAKLLPQDGAEGDEFGFSVAISPEGNGTAIVGAWWDDVACPGDPGCDSGSAYLFDAAAPGKCPWDLDNSGDVGVKDLLFLLGAWGPCPPKGDCLADFDTTGDVGVKDLLVLLGNWGPCP